MGGRAPPIRLVVRRPRKAERRYERERGGFCAAGVGFGVGVAAGLAVVVPGAGGGVVGAPPVPVPFVPSAPEVVVAGGGGGGSMPGSISGFDRMPATSSFIPVVESL